MTRGLHLILAALCVVGLVGSAFAFTPSVGPLPDIVIGDQTPIDTLTPGDITTAASTLENQLADANIFAFDNAFNIFNLVKDEPAGVPGFTSDELLIYRFTATPTNPALDTPGLANARISINGVLIDTTPTEVAMSDASAELDFADDAFSGAVDPLSAVGSLDYNFGAGFHPTNTTSPVSVTADLIDVNAMTLEIENQTGERASGDFVVYTVNDAPDAIIGGIAEAPETLDLSTWTFTAALSTAIGTFPGEAGAAGVANADNDSDGSVSDLTISIPSTSGTSYLYWASPANLIPFLEDGTYRLVWKVRRSGFANDWNTPQIRMRPSYGVFGELGSYLFNPAGVAAPPDADGRTYTQIIDQLEVAAATGTYSGFGAGVDGTGENGLMLFFDTVDFESTGIGGGVIELDSVELTRLNREVLIAQGTREGTVTAFNDAGVVGDYYGNGTGIVGSTSGTIALNQTAASTVMTSPRVGGAANGTSIDAFGNQQTLNTNGIGMLPFVPSAASGRFFRATIGLSSTSAQVGSPIPQVTMQVNTHPFSRMSTILNVSATQSAAIHAAPAPVNPALSAATFGIYLWLPEGAILEPLNMSPPAGQPILGIGDMINTGIFLVDSDDTAGGSVTVNQMYIDSYPESILP